jgi:metallo-beta-lactamase class B
MPGTPTTIEGLQGLAKSAAGLNYPGTFMRLCVPPPPPGSIPAGGGGGGRGGGGGGGGGAPPRENWYAEPAKVGDNFYFLGSLAHNSYALVATTGEIILIDALFEYATRDEIIDGLTKLGLDPMRVRYVLLAHAHGDHDGGAKLLQDSIPGVNIVYGEGDWPGVLARTAPHASRSGPENDGTDGRVVSVGDVSVRIVTMPGHTQGTLSFLFEFRDNGQPVRAAYVGGTAISFTNPDRNYYDEYIASAKKFGEAAAAFGATALLSNHTEVDNGYFKAHTAAHRSTLAIRNPFVVGTDGVANYFRVVEYCATAAKLRVTGEI